MRNRYALLVCASSTLAVAVGLASTSHAASQPRSAVAVSQETAAAPVSTLPGVSAGDQRTSDDLARYAAKDASSPEAKNYRGGDTVVIGASAATAILAVLLLVILL